MKRTTYVYLALALCALPLTMYSMYPGKGGAHELPYEAYLNWVMTQKEHRTKDLDINISEGEGQSDDEGSLQDYEKARQEFLAHFNQIVAQASSQDVAAEDINSGNNILHLIAAHGRNDDIYEKFETVLGRHGKAWIIQERLVSHKNREGKTPLHVAAASGNGNLVNKLLPMCDQGDIDNEDNKGQTPLLLAVMANQPDIAKDLVNNQMYPADICLGSDQITPGFAAIAQKWDLDTVKLLLEKKGVLVCQDGKVDAQYFEGNTLLHAAARSGSLEVIDYLLEKGAKVNVLNDRGQKPLDIAREMVAEAQQEVEDRATLPLAYRQESLGILNHRRDVENLLADQ